ncbi:hypothetical protein BCR44DRAFT_243048 [Catenaria anguillulae PL171]|uniref:Uncharacterized protein n=1 Tax=Catenaria anguillulae PL171 TaxID=765915 RepID=A0A1Y2I3R5_9FUNG|nr:hypothetical protein BCR44DRAFT_243048 [Catenaria anguillulae PL171]
MMVAGNAVDGLEPTSSPRRAPTSIIAIEIVHHFSSFIKKSASASILRILARHHTAARSASQGRAGTMENSVASPHPQSVSAVNSPRLAHQSSSCKVGLDPFRPWNWNSRTTSTRNRWYVGKRGLPSHDGLCIHHIAPATRALRHAHMELSSHLRQVGFGCF